MTKRIVLFLTALFCAGFLASCKAPRSGIEIESYPSNSIKIHSRIVGRRLAVLELNSRKRNDLLQVQITAENVRQKDVQFEYRFEWFDMDHHMVETTASTWKPVSVNAKGKVYMRGIAPSKDVEDFRFLVRPPRHSTRW